MTAKKPRGPAGGDDAGRALLMAALAHVPAEGFGDKAIARACAELDMTKAQAAAAFPRGGQSLVEAFSDWADAETAARLAKKKLSAMKVRERIRAAVLARLEVLEPHRQAARRAAAFLTLPPNAALGATLLYRTADRMWRAAGDTSTDFNFYTKRAILAGVWTSTLMRWFNDRSDENADTRSFLDARIDNVMQFEKFKAQMKERAKDWPSVADVLGGITRARRS